MSEPTWTPPDLSMMVGKIEEHVAQTYGRWEPDCLRAMVASVRAVFDDPDYIVEVIRRAAPAALHPASGGQEEDEEPDRSSQVPPPETQHAPRTLEEALYWFGAASGAVAIGADPACIWEAAQRLAAFIPAQQAVPDPKMEREG